MAPRVLETAMTHSRLYRNERRVLARELAALGERDAALTLWRHVLAFPHPPRSGEPQRAAADFLERLSTGCCWTSRRRA